MDVIDPPGQILTWDTNFFGFRIGQVVSRQLTTTTAGKVMDWCTEQRIKCLYFLVNPDDEETVKAAEDYGFHLVDIRMTLKNSSGSLTKLENKHQATIIRPFKLSDLTILKEQARSGFQMTRFYFDSNFSRERCDALYETWIEKSCHGYAKAVLVSETEGKVSGYITCHIENETRGSLGLVGVNREFQGRGIGKELVNAALNWFSSKNISTVIVVTQGRNYQAQRLYQHCGFYTDVFQLWFHKWFL